MSLIDDQQADLLLKKLIVLVLAIPHAMKHLDRHRQDGGAEIRRVNRWEIVLYVVHGLGQSIAQAKLGEEAAVQLAGKLVSQGDTRGQHQDAVNILQKVRTAGNHSSLAGPGRHVDHR